MDKKRTYNQLTKNERYHIGIQLQQGIFLSQIAAGMGRHKSTLGREVKRNVTPKGDYCSQAAQVMAKRRHIEKPGYQSKAGHGARLNRSPVHRPPFSGGASRRVTDYAAHGSTSSPFITTKGSQVPGFFGYERHLCPRV